MNLGTLKLSWAKTIEIFLWLAAVSVLVENVSLFRQNRSLQEALAPQIAAGTQLQMLSGLTLDGRIVPVGFPDLGSKLLILTFSPGCPACQANQAKWMSLANTLGQKGGVRVLWVSRDPIEITKEYCLKRGIPLSDVLADPPFRTYAQLGLARVPNTVLVDASGTVERVWAGRWIRPAGTPSLLILASGKRRLPRPRLWLGPLPRAAGMTHPVLRREAASRKSKKQSRKKEKRNAKANT